MDIINVSCAEIQTSAGFLYVILPVLLNQTNSPDCEQSWLSEDGRLIADPVNPQTLIDPVISVSSDRLVTSHCVNLNHEIICDSTDGLHFSHVTAFRARNQTAVTPNSDDLNQVTLQLSDQLWWLLAVFFILLVFLCFFLRKRIFRTMMKVRSDDPHAVQESEQLKAPEIEV
ncbi:hypothetical protein G5714_004047 [Onychostoma macrolepis]|uniref:Uncharacterized protein n=1 Tax=Onychostoma macrolepis TaxID=369639 RepID=A0A7J6DB45_9TELE|nr:hypothetical protein G5714_004047 [Onychostoma macrolepis]